MGFSLFSDTPLWRNCGKIWGNDGKRLKICKFDEVWVCFQLGKSIEWFLADFSASQLITLEGWSGHLQLEMGRNMDDLLFTVLSHFWYFGCHVLPCIYKYIHRYCPIVVCVRKSRGWCVFDIGSFGSLDLVGIKEPIEWWINCIVQAHAEAGLNMV